VKRFHITATYVLSFIALSFVRSMVTGHPFFAEVAPITGPMYQLYIFFMITDPKTTVKSKQGQILVAFIVAVAEMTLRLMQGVTPESMAILSIDAPYYALTIVGPAAMVIDILRNSKKKSPPKVSQSAGNTLSATAAV
jgi:enediyne biosynthesis protein E5